MLTATVLYAIGNALPLYRTRVLGFEVTVSLWTGKVSQLGYSGDSASGTEGRLRSTLMCARAFSIIATVFAFAAVVVLAANLLGRVSTKVALVAAGAATAAAVCSFSSVMTLMYDKFGGSQAVASGTTLDAGFGLLVAGFAIAVTGFVVQLVSFLKGQDAGNATCCCVKNDVVI